MPANVHNREAVDAKLVRLAIVTAEPVIRNAIAVVTAALLPGAVLRLPATCTITLPSDLLLARLSRAPLLCGPVVLLLLPLLALLILLSSSLLLSRGIVLLLTLLLLLLIVLPRSLLLILSCRVVLLLPLLALLILLSSGLLLLLR